MKIGQPSTQLSGGEAQRVKLATELSRRDTGRTLYILDEPTTGLHVDDVKRLLEILQRLCETGSSVLVIEHNLDVIKCADYVIDLGPEGGNAGGTVVATGTPEEVAQVEGSYTGQFLRKRLFAKTRRLNRAKARWFCNNAVTKRECEYARSRSYYIIQLIQNPENQSSGTLPERNNDAYVYQMETLYPRRVPRRHRRAALRLPHLAQTGARVFRAAGGVPHYPAWC